MGKVVVLNIESGSIDGGFTVSLQVFRDQGLPIVTGIPGTLPALSDLFAIYNCWYQEYQRLLDIRLGPITIDPTVPSNEAITIGLDACLELSRQLRKCMRKTLTNHQDPGWVEIRNRVFRELVNTADEIRVVIQADDPILWKLPWHEWDVLQERNDVEVAFSHLHSPAFPTPVIHQGDVRIVALVSDIPSLEQTVHQTIQNLQPLAPPKYPTSLDLLLQQLRHGCEVFIFAGHGTTGNNGIGRIIYGNSQITVDSFTAALRTATAQGLQLVFLCCCDGLGLVTDLKEAGVNVPVIIAMREEISVEAAQQFFKDFFHNYATLQQPLYKSFRQARERLENLEHRLPGTIHIPLIYQNISVKPPSWQELTTELPPPPPRPPAISLERRFLILMLLGFLVALIIYIIKYFVPSPPVFVPSPPAIALCSSVLPENVSFGDKLLNNKNTPVAAQVRSQNFLQEACRKFQTGDVNGALALFDDAYDYWKDAYQNNQGDGELFIYWNNAQLFKKIARYALPNANQINTLHQPNIIAVAIPIAPDNQVIQESANEIALGVAMAQKEFNQNNDPGLIVLIADDKNNNLTVKPIVDALKSQTPDILGVVGHFFSSLISSEGHYYNQKKLVLISPTATAVTIRPSNSPSDNYIFRVAPTDIATSETITAFIKQKATPGNVVIIHAKDTYGESLSQAVEQRLPKSQGWQISSFTEDDRRIKNVNTQIVVLIPNGGSRTSALRDAEQALQEGKTVVAGDSLFNGKTVDTTLGKRCLNGLFVAAPGYNLQFRNKFNNSLTNNSVFMGWRVPYAYDATLALLNAKPSSNTSNQVKENLKNLSFSSFTGNIEFNPNGDRVATSIMKSQLFKVEERKGAQCAFEPQI
ncbi:MAG: ABC transporter substrate-binding protein [Stigonema ocellatum SAG 48.90 = DSM 106950]|nr:ABC transporter substrate-binding protein [Stigonema ocellatum SAG 48.90 = DSM 106950]